MKQPFGEYGELISDTPSSMTLAEMSLCRLGLFLGRGVHYSLWPRMLGITQESLIWELLEVETLTALRAQGHMMWHCGYPWLRRFLQELYCLNLIIHYHIWSYMIIYLICKSPSAKPMHCTKYHWKPLGLQRLRHSWNPGKTGASLPCWGENLQLPIFSL